MQKRRWCILAWCIAAVVIIGLSGGLAWLAGDNAQLESELKCCQSKTAAVVQPPPAPTAPAVAPTPPPEVRVEVKEVVPQWVIDELARLRKENERIPGLEQKLASCQKEISVPAVPPRFELIVWTDNQAKELMRRLYPGNNKYRDPVFDSTLVYPLSWYNGILPAIPNEILDSKWPADLISWFTVRYPGIATGYVWIERAGCWELVKVVPAHKNGAINLYYLINRTWVEACSSQDTITSLVRAVNLLE